MVDEGALILEEAHAQRSSASMPCGSTLWLACLSRRADVLEGNHRPRHCRCRSSEARICRGKQSAGVQSRAILIIDRLIVREWLNAPAASLTRVSLP
jgi:hypothetical protein